MESDACAGSEKNDENHMFPAEVRRLRSQHSPNLLCESMTFEPFTLQVELFFVVFSPDGKKWKLEGLPTNVRWKVAGLS